MPRAAMTPGMKIDGPAIIVEEETATIVTSAFRAVGQGDGSLRLIRKEANAMKQNRLPDHVGPPDRGGGRNRR